VKSGLEMSCILWNPKGHYRVYKSPSLFLADSHMNPFQNLLQHLLKIRCASRNFYLEGQGGADPEAIQNLFYFNNFIEIM